MKAYYDLHMHTCLSPCSKDEMTPNNVVSMSMIKGLDVIAITDHNSIENCEAAIKVGKKRDVLVIPGMELQTLEDVHLICLFRDLKTISEFADFIEEKKLKIPNKPEKYGHQLILDANDETIGEDPYLLITSANISVEAAFKKVRDMGGFIFPAHIDRASNSLVTNLGFIPDNLAIKYVEVSTNPSGEKILIDEKYDKYIKLINSDAHILEKISERTNYIEVDELSIDSVFKSLFKEER
ncbi:MAG: PHP domain-containing protein [Acidaminobacteraceae bacterium]